MPKKKMQYKEGEEGFGARLERLRKATGYSLRELAREIETSHRMLIHYEKHAGYPSAQLLPELAKTLNVSTDQLLGTKQAKKNDRAGIIGSGDALHKWKSCPLLNGSPLSSLLMQCWKKIKSKKENSITVTSQTNENEIIN